jgi:hypothetical protein
MHQNDALLGLVRAEVARVHTTFPGVVVRYDRTRQTAAVQIVPRFRWRNPDTDELVFEQVPQLPDVPILFPAGSGVSLVWDLAAGDPVWVVVADRCIAEWKATGNADTEPQTPRRWDFSDAVAFPGGACPADPLSGTALPSAAGMVVLKGGDVRLGSSAAVSGVALAPLVEAQLTTLETALQTALTAGIAAGGGGVIAALTAMQTALTTALAAWPSTTAATKVKAE